jgi:NitT/TauT family transport system substrate-binding protein
MRNVALRLAALLFALAVTPVVDASVALADTVKIAHSTWVGYGPLYIARDKGIFKKNGVDVELIVMEDPKERFPTLIADRIQMIASTVDTALLYLKKPTDFHYVVAIDDSDGGDGIVAVQDIKTVADLKGRRVAVNEGSVSEFYLNVLLAKAGLKESDLQTVNMTAADAGGAFVAKRVDAAVTWEPWLSRGKATDFGHLLVDSSTTPGLITDVIIVKTDWAAAHKSDVAAVVKSWNEAVAFYEEHPDDAIGIMAKGVGGWLKNPKDFRDTLGGIKFYDAAANKVFFGT